MNSVSVKTLSKEYKIIIGWSILPKLGKILKKQQISESVFIISTDKIFGLYGKKLISMLKNSKISDLGFALLPDGEKSKSWESYEKLIKKIVDFDSGKEKRTTVVGLGGGVVGDIAGFVAGTYKRGVPFVQIPTTLLAMVDSSIGGKTGIDFRHKNKIVKNLLGQFYQPDLVFTDLSFLKTLPKRQLLNGLAEVIKYGIIKDEKLFEFLENRTSEILSLEKSAINYIVKTSCEIKKDIVQQDERETKSIRTILNYGHTIGHAIESASGLSFTHGEAISVGMIVEAKISNKLGLLKEKDLKRIENLIQKFGLPTKIKSTEVNKIISAMKYDKKFSGGKNKFVLPVRIGKVVIKTGIEEKKIVSILSGYF